MKRMRREKPNWRTKTRHIFVLLFLQPLFIWWSLSNNVSNKINHKSQWCSTDGREGYNCTQFNANLCLSLLSPIIKYINDRIVNIGHVLVELTFKWKNRAKQARVICCLFYLIRNSIRYFTHRFYCSIDRIKCFANKVFNTKANEQTQNKSQYLFQYDSMAKCWNVSILRIENGKIVY